MKKLYHAQFSIFTTIQLYMFMDSLGVWKIQMKQKHVLDLLQYLSQQIVKLSDTVQGISWFLWSLRNLPYALVQQETGYMVNFGFCIIIIENNNSKKTNEIRNEYYLDLTF